MHPLDGAYIRLDRAKEHLAELRTLIDAFVDKEYELYELIRQKERLDSERAKPPFRLRTGDSPIRLRFSVLVGETAYNLQHSTVQPPFRSPSAPPCLHCPNPLRGLKSPQPVTLVCE